MPTLYLGEYRIEVDDQGTLEFNCREGDLFEHGRKSATLALSSLPLPSGIVFEGALGFVAQIFPHYRQHSGAEKEPPRALKLCGGAI